LCRIGSISKSITAVAALRLVQDGKLGLDQKLFSVLPLEQFCKSVDAVDPRVREITVRHLLWQRSGLEQETHVIWASEGTAEAVGAKLPMSPGELSKFALLKPLVCNPGTDHHYANANYYYVSLMIDKITRSYPEYVKKAILAPCGISDMDIWTAHVKDRKPNEAYYYDLTGKLSKSVLPENYGEMVSEAYGGYGDYGATKDGWIASVIDLAKFMRVVFLTNRVLNQSSRALIIRPFSPADGNGYYGAGFNVEKRDTPNGPIFNWGHSGAMVGACGFIMGRFDGAWFIALSNASDAKGWPLLQDNHTLHDLADRVSVWPNDELVPDR